MRTPDGIKKCKYVNKMIEVFPNLYPIIACYLNENNNFLPFKFNLVDGFLYIPPKEFDLIEKNVIRRNINFLLNMLQNVNEQFNDESKSKYNIMIIRGVLFIILFDYILRNGNIIVNDKKLKSTITTVLNDHILKNSYNYYKYDIKPFYLFHLPLKDIKRRKKYHQMKVLKIWFLI
jgi:hypothetical protein